MAVSKVTISVIAYLKLQSIAGGFDAWASAGKPVVKPSLPSFESRGVSRQTCHASVVLQS